MLVAGDGGPPPLTGGAGGLSLFNAGRAVPAVSVQGGVVGHIWIFGSLALPLPGASLHAQDICGNIDHR